MIHVLVEVGKSIKNVVVKSNESLLLKKNKLHPCYIKDEAFLHEALCDIYFKRASQPTFISS